MNQKERGREFKKLLNQAVDLYKDQDFKKSVKDGGVPIKIDSSLQALKDEYYPILKIFKKK